MTIASPTHRLLPLTPAALALLCACPAEDPSLDTGGSSTGSTSVNDTLTITEPSVTITETTPLDSSSDSGGSTGSSSSTTAIDTGTTDSTDTGTTDSESSGTTMGPEPSLWEVDFDSGLVMDPAADDYGPGTYVYPMGVPMGTADLRSFQLSYTAVDQMLHFTLGLEAITDNTRISVMLLDDAAWANAGNNNLFTVGGTEVRAPDWDDNGVQMILMDPDSPLFDFGAINDIDPFSDSPRPDNAIYLRVSNDAPFLGADGSFSTDLMNLQRLAVAVDTMASPNTMTFDVDANWLVPYLDTSSTNLYVAVWAYTLIDLPMPQWDEISFGALELTETLGGLPDAAMENWRDCDAYDMMFFQNMATQEQFLLVPEMFMGDPAETVVTLEAVGEGILQIPT